jgi:hypothetical protein
MKIKFKYISWLPLLLFVVGASCKKDKDQPKLPPPLLNSPELITGLVINFVDSANALNKTTAEFRDPDGPGGNSPTRFDTIKLESGKTYYATILVLDETKNPVDTVSKVIEQEKDNHQFFFTHSGISLSTFYLDKDSKGLPFGLSTKWRTASSGTGTSKVVLKHQVGVKNGSEATGETDIEVLFQTIIN